MRAKSNQMHVLLWRRGEERTVRVTLGEVLGVTASTRNPFASGIRSPSTGERGLKEGRSGS